MEIICLNTEEGLKPMYTSDLDKYRRLKVGRIYSVDVKEARNYEFLKKFFALIKVGYDNTKTFSRLTPFGIYREWVMIKANHFDIYPAADGTHIVKAKSIAFDNMSEDEFREVYEDCLKVVIKDVGATSEQVEKQLIEFL